MAKLETAAECRVKIDGVELRHEISQVRLEQCIERHHELTVTLHGQGVSSKDAEIEDPSRYTDFLGKTVSLALHSVGGVVDEAEGLEFVGTVTQVSIDNSIDGLNHVIIVGHSPTIVLDDGQHNALYHDQKTTDIIGAVLQNYPITVGTVDTGKLLLPFSVQYRETDLEFIRRLASYEGLYAFYDGREFHVRKASNSSEHELVWRETLGNFSAELGTASNKFTARTWDPAEKSVLVGDVSGTPQGTSPASLARTSLGASDGIYSEPGFTAALRARDMSSLDFALARQNERSAGRMITCNGESVMPSVSVGHCVKIRGLGSLDNSYWINSVVHVLDESGKYHNTFCCSPLDLSFPQHVRSGEPPLAGLQSAIVIDNNDPEKQGRVKVMFPWRDGEETPWLRIATPHAGNARGWYCIPEIDDEVLVGFEHGCPDLPVVLASLYNGQDLPPDEAPDFSNNIKMFMSKSGNQIVFVDAEGAEEIRILQKDGKNAIVLGVGGPSIVVESEGDITIKGSTITLESTTGDIEIKSAGSMRQEAAADVEIKAGANLKAEGAANCDIKGGASCNVEGGALVKVKGAMVQIN